VHVADIINAAAVRAAAEVAEQFTKLHAGRYTAVCTTTFVALLHSDDNVSPQCCVQEGGLLLCFKQHWPDDILLVCLYYQSAGLQIVQHLANIHLVGTHFCSPPCAPVLQVASNSLLMK
jgi:hypothetical protein